MNLKCFIMAATVPLLFVSYARADVATTPIFFIELSEWDSGQVLTVGGTSTPTDTEGFTQDVFCPGECESDPTVRLNGLGDAIPFDSNVGATITTDEDGNATVEYENVGPVLRSVTLTTTLSPDQLDQFFFCSSDIFDFCGFQLFEPATSGFAAFDAISTGPTLEVLFTNGEIPSSAPEPRQYLMLLIAFGACLAADRFRRRARA